MDGCEQHGSPNNALLTQRYKDRYNRCFINLVQLTFLERIIDTLSEFFTGFEMRHMFAWQ